MSIEMLSQRKDSSKTALDVLKAGTEFRNSATF